MRIQRLAHVSDLHLGTPGAEDAAARLCVALVADEVDHVVVTGDLTDRGRRAELEAFRRAFAPLLDRRRMTIVPGNHDRLGDDVGREIMRGERVLVDAHHGLYLIRVDSTAKRNRSLLRGDGELTDGDLAAVDRALRAAPPGALVAILLHHHPLPLPEEMRSEILSWLLGWRIAAELERGRELLELARGRCDLVLHGHRHVPRALTMWRHERRPLGLYNAGSSTELGRVRIFAHAGSELLGGPRWLAATAPLSSATGWSEKARAELPRASGSRTL